MYELATTIPGIATDAVTPTGRLSARGGPRSVFPESQQSFPLAVVFPTVIPHFCCRAVMDWPRATFLLTMTLHSSDRNQAARANCSSAILLFSPFNESEKTRVANSNSVTDVESSQPRVLVLGVPMSERVYRCGSVDDHRGAERRESAGGLFADAARGSGDDRDATCEFSHDRTVPGQLVATSGRTFRRRHDQHRPVAVMHDMMTGAAERLLVADAT